MVEQPHEVSCPKYFRGKIFTNYCCEMFIKVKPHEIRIHDVFVLFWKQTVNSMMGDLLLYNLNHVLGSADKK